MVFLLELSGIVQLMPYRLFLNIKIFCLKVDLRNTKIKLLRKKLINNQRHKKLFHSAFIQINLGFFKNFDFYSLHHFSKVKLGAYYLQSIFRTNILKEKIPNFYKYSIPQNTGFLLKILSKFWTSTKILVEVYYFDKKFQRSPELWDL